MEFLFKKSDKVRYKVNGKMVMMIDEYDTVIAGVYRIGGPPPSKRYTGKVWCSWVNEKNERKSQLFDQMELEIVPDEMVSAFNSNTGQKGKSKGGHTYNVNLNGPNSRFNNESFDYSTNNVQINNELDEQLDHLKKELEKLQMSPDLKNDALELVQELNDQLHSGKPKMSLVKNILSGLSEHGSNIASITSLILQIVSGGA